MTKKKEIQAKAKTARENITMAIAENSSTEDLPNELREALWSVVSFEKCEASGLTYVEAEQKMAELYAQKVSGLCIVTDETAARISKKV